MRHGPEARPEPASGCVIRLFSRYRAMLGPVSCRPPGPRGGRAEGQVCTWARTFGRAGSALITGFASSVTSVSSAAVGVVIPTPGFLEIKS